MSYIREFKLICWMKREMDEGTSYSEFLKKYNGDHSVKELKEIWKMAHEVSLTETSWKLYLENVAVTSLRRFSDDLQTICKNGLSANEIVECLDFNEVVLDGILDDVYS